MSSNIKITRLCEYCENEFTAQTTVTRYCSHTCNRKHYKAKKRNEKINKSKKETSSIIQQPIEVLKAKEFLSVEDVCQLIGISRRTVFRLIEKGQLGKTKIGSRTIIKRTDLDSLLTS